MSIHETRMKRIEELCNLSNLVREYLALGTYIKGDEYETTTIESVLQGAYSIILGELNSIGLVFDNSVLEDAIDLEAVINVYRFFLKEDSPFINYLQDDKVLEDISAINDDDDISFIAYELFKYYAETYGSSTEEIIANRLFGKMYSDITFVEYVGAIIRDVMDSKNNDYIREVPNEEYLEEVSTSIKRINGWIDEVYTKFKDIIYCNTDILKDRVKEAFIYKDFKYFKEFVVETPLDYLRLYIGMKIWITDEVTKENYLQHLDLYISKQPLRWKTDKLENLIIDTIFSTPAQIQPIKE